MSISKMQDIIRQVLKKQANQSAELNRAYLKNINAINCEFRIGRDHYLINFYGSHKSLRVDVKKNNGVRNAVNKFLALEEIK